MPNRVANKKCGLLFAFAFGSCLAAQAATCSAPPEVSDSLRPVPGAAGYANVGNWYADHKQFDCAIDAFQSAHRLDPGSAHINYLLGLSLYMAGRPADAVEPLQHSVQSDPAELRPHLILATALTNLRRVQAAEEQWQAALQIDPHSAMAQDGLCKALLSQGRPEPVISLLRNSRLDEDLSLDLVEAYEMEDRLDDADKILETATRAYPSSSALMYALVTVDVREHHPEEGARVAEAYAHAHPHDFTAQKLYLKTLEFNGDPALAQPLAGKLLAQAPRDPELLYLAGMDECLAGRYQDARQHLEQAIALDAAQYGNSYNAHYFLGTALFQLNDFQGARAQLEIALDPRVPGPEDKKPQARYELAMALRNLGDAEAARQQLKLFEAEMQTAEDRMQSARKVVSARDEIERGEPEKAAALYRQALQATPNNAHLNYDLALVLDSTGDLSGERAALEQAVKIDPTFALAQYQLGYVESRQGDLSAAEQQFRRAVEAAPDYTNAWVSLAATLGMESRFPEAQQAIARALRLAPNNQEALQLHRELAAAQNQP